MGRNLSGGILTRISIRKATGWRSDNNFDLKKEFDKVLDDISKFIDISKYDISEYNGVYNLSLNVDFINENIYDLLVEMNQVNDRISFVDLDYDVSSISDEYVKNHPITCCVEEDNYVLKYDGCENNEYQLYFPFYWIMSNEKLFYNVDVYGSVIPIWFDIGKFSHEDETFILMMMNTMKTKYFKSELSKCLIFEVIG